MQTYTTSQSEQVASIQATESYIAQLERQLYLFRCTLSEQTETLEKARERHLVEVQHMLSGNRKYWEVRQPDRVLRRLERFVGGKPEGERYFPESAIHHRNGDPTDNSPENLELVDIRENRK